MSRPVPLVTLLAWTWTAHAIEADNAFEAASRDRAGRLFRISLAMWTNGLRVIDRNGTTVEQQRFRAGAACNIGGLERWGWLSVGDPGVERRDGYGSFRGVRPETVLRPTKAGAYAQRLWPEIVAEVEDRWRDRFGTEVIDAVVDALPMPEDVPTWSPPEIRGSNGFRTGVIPGGPSGDDLPLAARLGRSLTAFTVDYERRTAVSLPLAANILRVIDTQTLPIRDLPAHTGLSKEAIAIAAGYLQRHQLAEDAGDRRRIRLTVKGKRALREYRTAVVVDDPRLREALEALLVQPEAISAGLVPADGCWRGERPYLNRTRKLLADPIGTLPWHPMVLHRGGWPDGS